MHDNALTPKVALITGAARRIGADITRTLHAAGMNVILHYHLSVTEARVLCEELNDIRPHSAVMIAANLAEIGCEQALIDKAAAVWDRLDVLINNASRFYRTVFTEVKLTAWDDLINTNLRAPFFLAQAAAPFLRKTQGVIINITDIHAERPLHDYPIYCLTKSGLLHLTTILAKELAPAVRVNAVAPGAIAWPEGENSLSEIEKQKIIDDTMLKHLGCANDIAIAVLFLVRDAHYVTGQVLNVDGGRILCA